MIDKKDRAFPARYRIGSRSWVDESGARRDEIHYEDAPGLTKREYMAAVILSGICANPATVQLSGKSADTAVQMADALLARLAQ